MTNERIRKVMKDKNLKQWQVAEIIGVSETTMVRKMRAELSKAEQDRIIKLIKESGKKEG